MTSLDLFADPIALSAALVDIESPSHHEEAIADAVEGALRSADRRSELAAASLGASPWQIFRLVTVPLTAPGIAAGAVLCFARALGEFGATITFAGSFPGVTRTLPIASYLAMNSDPDTAIALALVLLAVSLGVLLALRDRWLPGTA